VAPNNTFMILSDARSGTMLLTDSLDTREDTTFFNLYASNPDNKSGHYDNWLRFLHTSENGITHRGTTMHRVGDGWIDTLSPIPPGRFWSVVAANVDKCICLRRDNLLRRFLSIKVGVLLKSYKVDKPRDVDPGPVMVPMQELMEFIGSTRLLHEKIDGEFSGRIEIHYEDLAARWDETLLRIQTYLGMDVSEIQPVTFRQETRPLVESIQNYAEVKTYLSNQGLSHWLEEPLC